MELTWEELGARASAVPEARETLEAEAAATGEASAWMRLARACVRDHRLAEALIHYDAAERLGHAQAREELDLVARHLGDFPRPGEVGPDSGLRLA